MRRSIYIEGFGHGANPVPAAAVLGNLLMSGAVFGTEPATGKLADTAERQCALMFANVGRILEAAGGSFADVLKMTFYLRPEVPRALINAEWTALFPDPAARPARHVVVSDRLPQGMHLQCDVFAVLRSA